MSIDPRPKGLSSVTPSLVVTPCGEAIDWYVKVFGATERGDRMLGPDGSVGHAEIQIGDAVVMLGDEWPGSPVVSPRTLGGTATALFIYDQEAPAIWERALANGATVVFPWELQFYGDEGGRIEDPFGHTWGIGRHVEDVSDEEMARRVKTFYEDNPQD